MAAQFFAKVILFLVLIAASMQLIFVGARRLEKPFFEDSTYAWVTHLNVHPKVVLMGSSTVLNNLSPRRIASVMGLAPGEVINLGGGSKGALQMYHLWQVIKPNRDSVRVVVFSIDPWIAYQSYYWIEDFATLFWNPLQRLYPATVDNWPRYVMSGAVATDVVKKSAQHLLHVQGPQIEAPSDFGGEILNVHLKNYREHTREYFGPIWLFPISQLYFDRLRKLKQQVEAQGAEFVLLLPPKKQVWVEGYRNNCRDIDSDFVLHLNQALGATKVIMSYHLFLQSEEDSLFMDHVHMSAEGQRRLSDSLAVQLDQLSRVRKLEVRPLLDYERFEDGVLP